MKRARYLAVCALGLACDSGGDSAARVRALEQRLAQLDEELAARIQPSGEGTSFEAAVCDRVFPWAPPVETPTDPPSFEDACTAFYTRIESEDREAQIATCIEAQGKVRKREGETVAALFQICLVESQTEASLVDCLQDARVQARPEREWAHCMFELELERKQEDLAKLEEIYACYATASTVAQFEACEARAMLISNRVDDPDSAKILLDSAKREAERIFDGIEARGCPPSPKSQGKSGPTPGLSYMCSTFSSGNCQPTDHAPSESSYARSEWSEDVGWQHVGFAMEHGDPFHYELEWTGGPSPAACDLSVRIYGDLDADEVNTVYARSAHYGQGKLERGEWEQVSK